MPPLDVTVIEYRGPTVNTLLHRFSGTYTTSDGENMNVDFFVDPVEAAAIARALQDGFVPKARVPLFMLDNSTAVNGEVA